MDNYEKVNIPVTGSVKQPGEGKNAIPLQDNRARVKPTLQMVKGSRAAGETKGKSNKQIKKQKEQSQSARSYNNLYDYRPGWVRDNNITEAKVKEFLKTYEFKKIRGHASGDNSKGEQDVTTRDLNAYKSWHTRRYNAWY